VFTRVFDALCAVTTAESLMPRRHRFSPFSYFKNSSFHSPSHFGASASDLIGSTMTYLY
jgi:hypothetical protein